MTKISRLIGVLLLLLLTMWLAVSAVRPAVANPTTAPSITLTNAFPGLSFAGPTAIVSAGDTRLFVTEQAGRIRVATPGDSQALTFLDITGRVGSGGERGLLGLAFHPNFFQNGYFYVNYTNNQGDTRVSRFSVTADPNIADPASELILLHIDQPEVNHNGGDLHFGPDGYLYIATGDGGSSNDPWNNGQRLDVLLGKLLRIDVDGKGDPPDCDVNGRYTVPPDNPFADTPGACAEIWSYGLRNPWRFSFDRQTGDIFIGDVGQLALEEIDFQPATSTGGENYGWCYYEGTQVNSSATCQAGAPSNHTPPVFEYSHGGNPDRCSVTGGYRYRGVEYPSLQGIYLYGDFCSGQIWGLTQGSSAWTNELVYNGSTLRTFGEDACGTIYASQGGAIHKVEVTGAAPAPNLCLGKSGPTVSGHQAPIVYTLHVNNTGTVAATNLTISDTLPAGATYLGGGTLQQDSVVWQLPTLAPGETITLQFTVSATETITNSSYVLTADGGYVVAGQTAVRTFVGGPEQLYLPVSRRQ